MLKPLKDLLQDADKFLGQTKTAAPAMTDEVSSLADTLAFATQLEEQFSGPATAPANLEFEKVAKAINKLAAKAELEVMAQSEQFRETALARGYTEDQVTEALSKIAAEKIKKNLSTLAALGMVAPGGEDKNSLKPTPVKAGDREKGTLPLAHSFGGAE